MPPKKDAASKKSVDKAKTKIVEDKTFGLKNKKGAKQQKFIQQVQKQVKGAPVMTNDEREKKKEEEKKKKEELQQLFKPVLQTVAKGVDPKSVVCVYFKQGLCQKGDKCKFSHDLAKERKSEKRNIYEDVRDNEQETMENWDESKLEDVINKKHGEDNVKKNQTQIVCKYFIEAVENKTYGWFWSCPNGEKCMYRHALPPGFTLKSDMKKKEQDDETSLEMHIEKERASLGQTVTRITLETFLQWKARKITEKKEEKSRQDEKKRTDFKLGFMNGLTGRDLFTFNPDLIANDDDDAENDIDYRHRAEDDDDEANGNVRDVSAEFLAMQAREVDGTGTTVTDDRFSYLESMLEQEKEHQRKRKEAREAQEKLDMACGGGASAGPDENDEDDEKDYDNQGENGEENDDDDDLTEEEHKKSLKKIISEKGKSNKTNGGIEIDESLFNLEELADIRDELEDLDI